MRYLSAMNLATAPLCLAARIALLLPVAALWAGCGRQTGEGAAGQRQRNKQAIDTAVAMLKTGNIVLRMGRATDSYMLSLLNQTDKSYSHCGIVVVEGGYPFVYHSIGGEDNPEARVRRDSAVYFFSPQRNNAIAVVQYDLDDSGINALVATAKDYYRRRLRFDLKFDLKTDDQLYCTEFVYKAVTYAARDTAYLPTSRLPAGYYVAPDNLYINKHARLIWHTQFK